MANVKVLEVYSRLSEGDLYVLYEDRLKKQKYKACCFVKYKTFIAC